MSTEEGEGPSKRAKVSREEEEVIDLDDSEDDNREEDVKLENQLRDAQADLDKIHDEMLSRLKEVEHEFELRKAPFYKQRGEVIKSIPGFWLHCFLQHQDVKDVIGDIDQQVLSSLIEIAVEPEAESRDGYKLAFKFASNDWIEDNVLTKHINFVTDKETGSQICSTLGSKPKWKKQDPTVGDDAEKAAGGAPFLSWLVSDRALEPGHVDTLADIIKDQLFVNPLEYLEAEALSENLDVDELLEEDLDPATLDKEDALDELDGNEDNEDEAYDLDQDEDAQIAGGEDDEEGVEEEEEEEGGEQVEAEGDDDDDDLLEEGDAGEEEQDEGPEVKG